MDYSVWITLDNKHLKISEMTIDHIKNCIKMIKRSKFLDVMERYDTVPEPPPRYVVDYDQYKPYLKTFKNELETRLKSNLNGSETMKLSEAKKIKLGDFVTLKTSTGEYEITDIDKSLTTNSHIRFWSFNNIFDHKQIEKSVNKSE